MEVKPKALESTKVATKVEDDEKKTKKDDLIFKGRLKIIDSLRKAKTRDGQSPKSSASPPPSSLSYVMKIKMGNCVFSDDYSTQKSKNTKQMENLPKNKKENLKLNKEDTNNVHKMKKVWDCESTLYDSFELNSFNRQLNSAISSSARSISMPHLPSPRPSSTKKQSPNKISHSLQKLILSMFRHKQSNTTSFKACHDVDIDKYYIVDKTGSLTTIPESRESRELVGSENKSLIRKTVSERFPSNRLVGI